MSLQLSTTKCLDRPSFLNALVAGFAMSVLGALVFHGSLIFVSFSFAALLMISILAAGYVTYLCVSTQQKTGWMSSMSLLSLVLMVALVLSISIVWFIALNVLIVWGIRSSKYYRSPACSLADLCLVGLGIGLAFATLLHTSSVFLGLWVFFLIQALVSLIPVSLVPPQSTSSESLSRESDFDQAANKAKSALHQLKQYS